MRALARTVGSVESTYTRPNVARRRRQSAGNRVEIVALLFCFRQRNPAAEAVPEQIVAQWLQIVQPGLNREGNHRLKFGRLAFHAYFKTNQQAD